VPRPIDVKVLQGEAFRSSDEPPGSFTLSKSRFHRNDTWNRSGQTFSRRTDGSFSKYEARADPCRFYN